METNAEDNQMSSLSADSATAAAAPLAVGQKREKIRMTGRSRERERWFRAFFTFCGFFSMIVMALIMIFLFREGTPIFFETGLWDFLTGVLWYPTYDPPDFGIGPLILGSVAVTFIASVIAVPLGLGTALYLTEVASGRVREIVKPLVELLASLPSVVLGFVGMVIIAPLMQELLDIPSGLNVLNCALALALMAIPTIASISEDALHAVPRDLIESSLALGATRYETLMRVKIPGALSGMGTAVILGMSRAMGETMVVLMAAGGAAQIPGSIFDSVRPLPATIAAEMGETPVGSAHYHALFGIGMVLFFITLGFNLVATWISVRFTQRGAATL